MAAKPADIQSLLECCICLGECQDPRLLPCAHSLCKHCLDDHIKASAQGGQFQCPACRRNLEVPDEGASDFPKNFFLNNLRDILQKQRGEHKQAAEANVAEKAAQVECSNKDAGNITHTSVTVYCVDCWEYLCSNCEYFHRKLLKGSHDLRPVEEVAARGGAVVQRRRQKPNCDRHPALQKDMYCDSCRIPMCMKCCLLTHQQHKYRELDDLAEEQAAKLAELTQAAEKRCQVLEKHLKQLDKRGRNMDSDAEQASRKVCDAADELIELVIKRKQTLVQEIKDIHAVAATELKAACKETELNKASVQSLLSYIEALRMSGDVSDQVVHTPGLQEQLRQQEASQLKSVSWTVDFKRNTENVATVGALLGTVSTEQTVHRPVSLDDDKKVKLGSQMLTLSLKISHWLVGITKIGDCICVVGLNNPNLWIHKLTTTSSRQHTITALLAAGMTTVGNNSNTLVITDSRKKLHFITIDPQNMSITKQLNKDISFWPRSIVYDHTTDRLVIANKSDQQVVICSKTGDIEKRVTVKTVISKMQCALATAGDAYIVLDCSNPGRVHWVNQSGDVTHTYGAGAGEHLKDPWHMLQDSQGLLLVADTNNHCIRLINNQQFSHHLITQRDDIQYPACVYLDETAGTLYVGYNSYSNGLKLNTYKWPFKPASWAQPGTVNTHFKVSVNLGRFE